MASDYPLNCIESTGDGFSGWFAITNPRQCNDFCYWSVDKKKKSSSASDDTNENKDDNEDDSYTALNTANPHETTVIYNAASTNNDTTWSTEEAVAHWVCIYNSAGDKTLVSQAEGEKWIDTWHKYLDKRTMSTLYPTLHDDDGKNNNINVPFPSSSFITAGSVVVVANNRSYRNFLLLYRATTTAICAMIITKQRRI